MKVFTGIEGLKQIQDKWNFIFEGLSKKKFYYHYEWYKCYLDFLESDKDAFHCFIIYREKLPIAIFPLIKKTRKFYGINLMVLESPIHSQMFFTDFIYEANEENKDILKLFLKYLSREKYLHWDAVILNDLPPESPVIHSILNNNPIRTITEIQRKCSYFKTEGNYEKLQRAFESKQRNTLKKSRKKLKAFDEVEYISSVKINHILSDFVQFMEVEASGWKGEQGEKTAIKCNNNLIKFYRCLIEKFGKTERCRIHLLKVNGECIATDYCLLDKDTIYDIKIGFNEEYAHVSPGSIILDNLLQEATKDDKIRYVNWIAAQEWHKRWGPKVHNVLGVYMFNSTIWGILGFLMIKVKPWIRPFYMKYIKDRWNSNSR